MSSPSPHEIVRSYFTRQFHVVYWPDRGNQKGPTEEGWKTHPYTLDDYTPESRVGVLTGTEIAPHRFLHDVDLDWAPGYRIALTFLPKTEFVYGRSSKFVSHCFYTLPEAIPNRVFRDPVDKVTLLEIRGTKENGELGFQSMVPPSVWEKDGQREPLEFRAFNDPTHFVDVAYFTQRVTLGAIGMLLAKRFGHNGFGHEARLCWAGFLLRAGVAAEDLIAMGEAMGVYCNNQEMADVRRVVESTVAGLANDAKKVKGGPALAKLIGGDVGKAVVAEIKGWLGRDSDFLRVDGVIVKDNQDNVRRALQLLDVDLSYQEFAERMLVREGEGPIRPLDDRTLNHLWLRVDREHRFRPSFVFFEKVLTDSAYEHAFHPVRDYLRALQWDGISRVDSWLATYGAADRPGPPEHESDDEQQGRETSAAYLAAISAIVLIAAVRRVWHPGCKYDELLVLESAQGLNKSTALRALCPQEEWFSDDLPLNCEAKEIIERTLGKWIIEASDLVGGRKADRDHLKSMLSRQVDGPARMAYAHMPVERPRQFIIIGTTNSAEYLADTTGSRRFWPVRVGKFDVEGIVRDRDQLWAEAVVREHRGESIRLPERLWDAAGVHQEQRREVDAWESEIERYVDDDLDLIEGFGKRTSVAKVCDVLKLDMARRDLVAARRISAIMQRLGFKRQTVWEEGRAVQGYVRKPRSSDEEAATRKDQKAKAKKDDVVPF